MITVVDAKKPPAAPGSSQVLAAPLGPDGAQRTVGPFALVAHFKLPMSAPWRQGRVKLPLGDTESFTPCPSDEGRPLWRLNS